MYCQTAMDIWCDKKDDGVEWKNNSMSELAEPASGSSGMPLSKTDSFFLRCNISKPDSPITLLFQSVIPLKKTLTISNLHQGVF